MSVAHKKQGRLASGWILVSALLLLCITGTGLTWWNYSRQVFSSARGVVQNKGSASLVMVNDFPARALEVIEPGHLARITIGKDDQIKVMKGSVISVDQASRVFTIRVVEDPARHVALPDGMLCAVTIDTTVPPMENTQ